MRLLGAALLMMGATLAAKPALSVNASALSGTGYPAALSDYGFFADAAAQKPARGVTPYRLNTPLWSDGAEKLRFVYIPRGQQAKANGDGLLDLPIGAALI